MDIEKIKQIVSSQISEDFKSQAIIEVLSRDEKVIPLMMDILKSERKSKDELIADMNLELSRAHIYIDMRPEVKSESKDSFNKSFINDEIAKFYIKYKSIIAHCFNRFN